ncbi:MAG: hypothetical protein FWG73_02225 [Planctomycetaceae bacterium]|nr:hypothetical protein [Planctomycetaceae bacterium]
MKFIPDFIKGSVTDFAAKPRRLGMMLFGTDGRVRLDHEEGHTLYASFQSYPAWESLEKAEKFENILYCVDKNLYRWSDTPAPGMLIPISSQTAVYVAKILELSEDMSRCSAQCLDRDGEATGEILENIRLLGTPVADAYISGNWDGMAGILWRSERGTAANVKNRNWRSVCFGNGKYVAVASHGARLGRIMTSDDAEVWTARLATYSLDWWSVCYGNGKFVAVSCGGNGCEGNATTKKRRVMYSHDDGVNWSECASLTAKDWRGVCYGNGCYVAVGNKCVMYSTDAHHWTLCTLPSDAKNNLWRSVCYSEELGLFVAVSSNGAYRVMTSPDGITWTARLAAKAHNAKGKEINCTWKHVCFAHGKFVAVADNTTGHAMVSTDGINWHHHAMPAKHQWQSVCYGRGLFVAVANSGAKTRVAISPDGEHWYSANAAEDRSWESVCYGNGKFIAVAISGTNRIMISDADITFSGSSAYSVQQSVIGQSIIVVEQDGQLFAIQQGGGIFASAEEEEEERLPESKDDEEDEKYDDGTIDIYGHIEDPEAHR